MGANIMHRLDIISPEIFYNQILGLLAREATFGWEEKSLNTGETIFSVHCANKDYLDMLMNVAVQISSEISFEQSEFEETPWHEAWKEFFTPVFCGSNFVILPPWLASKQYEGRKKIIIEPECAFGTGHHATTTLCLGALSELLDKKKFAEGAEFLDLGCGSGVLGIGAALFGLKGLGLDIDELAIKNAEKNKQLNNAEKLKFGHGSVDIAKNRKFDLVMANILARPLIELAPDIVRILARNGVLILSGILDIQAQAVEDAYTAQGLPKAKKITDGEWRCLVWELA